MRLGHFTLGSLILGSSLLLATGIPARSMPQPDNDHDNQKRYYDRDHKDYHAWDDREDQAYRRWLDEDRHEKYRDFSKLKRAEQNQYWQWRHEHGDNDKH